MSGDVPLDRPAGETQAIPFGHEHLEQLAPPSEQCLEELRGFVWQGAHRGADPLAKWGEDAGIDQLLRRCFRFLNAAGIVSADKLDGVGEHPT